MNFVQHPTNNHAMGAPKGWDHGAEPCGTLPMTVRPHATAGVELVSYWKPTVDELIELNSGGLVTLHVLGAGHPVVAMGVVPRPTVQVQMTPAPDTPRRRAGDAA